MMNSIPKVKQAKITKRKIAEPEFKKPGKITGLEFLHNYYKKLDKAHTPETRDMVLSRREEVIA